MGALGRALNMMLGNNDSHELTGTSKADSSAAIRIDNLPDAEALSPFELIYQLHKEDGVEVIGSPNSAFATFDPSRGKITVYAKDDGLVEVIRHRTVSIIAALECAKDEGANFTVCGSQVICVLKNVTAYGSSYGEAALRALLKFQRQTAGNNIYQG